MDTVTLYGRTFVPYIKYEEIMGIIDEVACCLIRDYGNSEDVPVLLCTLDGAMMFTSEILKRVPFRCELMSVKVKSYSGSHSTGVFHQAMGLTGDVSGRRVIILEDIVDTGNTMEYLINLLHEKNARDVKICTMLFKPAKYKQKFKLDYIGKEVEDKFILGFGLDYDELGRNLKDIYVLDE